MWLAVSLLLLAGCGVTVGIGGAADGPEQRTGGTERVDGAVRRVEVDADAGDVRLTAGTSSSVVKDLRWSGSPMPEVEQRLDGDVLRVTARCPRRNGGHCEANLTITVPAASSARTSVAAGDVTADGLTGALDLETAGGDVQVTGAGPADVRAGSTGGGVDVALARAAPSVTAETTGGDVVVRVPSGRSYDVSTETTAGDEQVDVPTAPGAGNRVSARTTAGDVTVTS